MHQQLAIIGSKDGLSSVRRQISAGTSNDFNESTGLSGTETFKGESVIFNISELFQCIVNPLDKLQKYINLLLL